MLFSSSKQPFAMLRMSARDLELLQSSIPDIALQNVVYDLGLIVRFEDSNIS
jgi:hypothetical protein